MTGYNSGGLSAANCDQLAHVFGAGAVDLRPFTSDFPFGALCEELQPASTPIGIKALEHHRHKVHRAQRRRLRQAQPANWVKFTTQRQLTITASCRVTSERSPRDLSPTPKKH